MTQRLIQAAEAVLYGDCSDVKRAGPAVWRSENDPPDGEVHKWSREVVAITNYGDVFLLSYMHGPDGSGGYWQRPGRFNEGEKVEFWTDHPLDQALTDAQTICNTSLKPTCHSGPSTTGCDDQDAPDDE